MMEVAAADIQQLGGSVELVNIGKQKLPDGSEIPLPPILLGKLGSDPQKKTVCIYGHLDVQPAALEDGWDSEPFTLVERDGKLYGRGSTDDKGPVAGWMNALEAYQKTNQDIPVNVRFCLEGMEESGSEGLDELIFAQKDKFLETWTTSASLTTTGWARRSRASPTGSGASATSSSRWSAVTETCILGCTAARCTRP